MRGHNICFLRNKNYRGTIVNTPLLSGALQHSLATENNPVPIYGQNDIILMCTHK